MKRERERERERDREGKEREFFYLIFRVYFFGGAREREGEFCLVFFYLLFPFFLILFFLLECCPCRVFFFFCSNGDLALSLCKKWQSEKKKIKRGVCFHKI